MKGRSFEEIVEKAERWGRYICGEICSNRNRCYSNKAPLLFPPLRQKIVFISESPYNFPREGCETLNDFLEKDLLRELKNKKKRANNSTESMIPRDIFDFIYLTFNPVFSISSENLKPEDVERFLRCVYWTHAAKRSLKGCSKKDAERCREATVEELGSRSISPRLMVIASSLALRLLFGEGYSRSVETQSKIFAGSGKLPKLKELFGVPQAPRLQKLQDCEIAVFPNPSGANAYWKSRFYRDQQELSCKIVKYVHSKLREIYQI
jgi:hypothetical protein